MLGQHNKGDWALLVSGALCYCICYCPSFSYANTVDGAFRLEGVSAGTTNVSLTPGHSNADPKLGAKNSELRPSSVLMHEKAAAVQINQGGRDVNSIRLGETSRRLTHGGNERETRLVREDLKRNLHVTIESRSLIKQSEGALGVNHFNLPGVRKPGVKDAESLNMSSFGQGGSSAKIDSGIRVSDIPVRLGSKSFNLPPSTAKSQACSNPILSVIAADKINCGSPTDQRFALRLGRGGVKWSVSWSR